MKVVSASEIERELTSVHVLMEIRKLLLDGAGKSPPRMHLLLENGGVLLVMPAFDKSLAITKTVTVHPENGARGLPVVSGQVLVLNAESGTPLALMDGPALTAIRTAAVTLLAAELLAVDPSGPLLLIGSGVQAEAHARAFVQRFATGKVTIVSRSAARAKACAGRLEGLGVRCEIGADAGMAARACSVIVAATTSSTPVLTEPLSAGKFVAGIGAFTSTMAELGPKVVLQGLSPGCRLVVDTLEGARREAGDLIQAAVDWARVAELRTLLQEDGTRPDVAVFKSVGTALWDLAAAKAAAKIGLF